MMSKNNSDEKTIRDLEFWQSEVAFFDDLVTKDRAGKLSLAMSLTELYSCLSQLSRYQDAFATCQRMVDIYETLTEDNPFFAGYLASSLGSLAFCYFNLENFQMAISVYHRAIGAYEPLIVIHVSYEYDLAQNLANLGHICLFCRNLLESIKSYERAIKIYEGMVDKNPTHAHEEKLAYIWVRLGKAYKAININTKETIRILQNAVRIYERLTASDSIHEEGYATSLGVTGSLYLKIGDYLKSSDCYFRAEKIHARINVSIPSNYNEDRLVDCLEGQAEANLNLAQPQLALDLCVRAIAMRESIAKKDTSIEHRLLKSYGLMGHCYNQLKRHQDAEDACQKALLYWCKIEEIGLIVQMSGYYLRTINILACSFDEQGKHDLCIETVEHALSWLERADCQQAVLSLYGTPEKLNDLFELLFNIYIRQGNYSRMLELKRRYFQLLKNWVLSPDHSANFQLSSANLLSKVAKILFNRGEYFEALEFARGALDYRRKYPLDELYKKEGLANALCVTAKCYSHLQLDQEAIIHCEEAVSLIEDLCDSSILAWCHLDLACYYPLSEGINAVIHAQKGVQILEKISKKDLISSKVDFFNGLIALATLYKRFGRPDYAIVTYRRANAFMSEFAGHSIIDSTHIINPAVISVRFASEMIAYVSNTHPTPTQLDLPLIIIDEGKIVAEAVASLNERILWYCLLDDKLKSETIMHLHAKCLRTKGQFLSFSSISTLWGDDEHAFSDFVHSTIHANVEAISLFEKLRLKTPIKYDRDLALSIDQYLDVIQYVRNFLCLPVESMDTESLLRRLGELLTQQHLAFSDIWPNLIVKYAERISANERLENRKSSFVYTGFFRDAANLFIERFEDNVGSGSDVDFQQFEKFYSVYYLFVRQSSPEILLELVQRVQGQRIRRMIHLELNSTSQDDTANYNYHVASSRLSHARFRWDGIVQAGHNYNEHDGKFREAFNELTKAKEDYESTKIEALKQNELYLNLYQYDFHDASKISEQLTPGEAVLIFVVCKRGSEFFAVSYLIGKAHATIWQRWRKQIPTHFVDYVDADELVQIGIELSKHGILSNIVPMAPRRSGTMPVEMSSSALTDPGRAVSIMDEILVKLQRWVSSTIKPYLRGIERIHICTSDPLHVLPWHALTKLEQYQIIIYPGVHFFLQAQNRKNTESVRRNVLIDIKSLPSVACADPCLDLPFRPETSSRFPSGNYFRPISHAAIDAELAGLLCNATIVANADLFDNSWKGQDLAYLHLACHGEHGKGLDSFLFLGKPWTISDILGSGIRARVVFLSACLSGKTSDDYLGNPMGIASAFLLSGTRIVIGWANEVPDHLMPLMVGLVYYHLNKTCSGSWYQAAHLARKQFGAASWPAEDYSNYIAMPYAKSLIALYNMAESSERWDDETLSKCKYIDEGIFVEIREKIADDPQTKREDWDDLLSRGIVAALDSIRTNPQHPNRPLMRDMATYMQIMGTDC